MLIDLAKLFIRTQFTRILTPNNQIANLFFTEWLTLSRARFLSGLLLVSVSQVWAHPVEDEVPEVEDKGMVHFISLSSAYEEEQLAAIYAAYKAEGYTINTDYLRQEISDLGYVDMDSVRAQNLIEALTDDEVTILWGIRGGGGALNLLPHLIQALPALQQAKPKILVGYSDMSALHFFIAKYLPHWRSVHGNVAVYSSQLDPDTNRPSINDLEPIPDIHKLFAEGIYYDRLLPLNRFSSAGMQGKLLGGNLELMRSTFGTDYTPNFEDKIIFLEDIGISYRQLDRMLNQLLMHKDFAKVKGVVMGQFFSAFANDAERSVFKRTVENFAERFPKPVYYYPNIGHGRKNNPLIIGAEAVVSCNETVYCQLFQMPEG